MDAPGDFPTQGVAEVINNAIYMGDEMFEQPGTGGGFRILRFMAGDRTIDVSPTDNVKIKLLSRISEAKG